MSSITPFSCPLHDTFGSVDFQFQPNVEALSKPVDGGLSIEITTRRLKIVSVTSLEYLPQLIALYGSSRVNEKVGGGETLPQNLVEAKVGRWIDRWSKSNPFSGYVILETEGNHFVGQIVLKRYKDKSDEHNPVIVQGAVEIGYLSMPQFWGKGYAQEVGHAVAYHLLPKFIEKGCKVEGHRITYLMATAREDNEGSNKVSSKFSTTPVETKDRYGAPRKWYRIDYPQ